MWRPRHRCRQLTAPTQRDSIACGEVGSPAIAEENWGARQRLAASTFSMPLSMIPTICFSVWSSGLQRLCRALSTTPVADKLSWMFLAMSASGCAICSLKARSKVRVPQTISTNTTPRLQTSAAIPLYSRTRSTSGATKGKVPQGLLHVAWLPKTKARSKSASFNVRSSDVSLMMKFSGFKSRWQMRGPMWRCSTTPNACVMEDTTFIKDSGRCLPLRLSRPASRW
mmetsp:Transcript_60336/g.194290  ORF Transcript_60336/g.194290 Transcript_60336/m.194290 type:complete len:226 (+) Transcript_60336:86-763(+)